MNKQKPAMILLLFAAILTMISCNNSTKEIASIKIGTQTWAAKNLDVSTFRNGDSIPEVKTPEEWVQFGNEQKPAWSYYNNDPGWDDGDVNRFSYEKEIGFSVRCLRDS
jgi:hypothetical protein